MTTKQGKINVVKKPKIIKKKKEKTPKEEIKEKEYNFIEVCSGAGGLSTGFMNQGFKPILLNDFDKTCCKTLEKNHKDNKIIHGSFVDIDYSEYKDVDIMMGGVPCQAFSQAGKRLGLEDARGNLLIEFIKIVKRVKPKVFLIENVKGLLTHESGNTFQGILDVLEEIDKYNIHYKVLNANDYGVAQKRERLIIIGVDKEIKKEYKFPEKENYKPVLEDVLINVPESKGLEYSESKKRIMSMVPQGGCWVNLPEEVQREYMKASYNSGGGKRGIARRLSMKEACLTLTTSPCQKQTERCHPIETRPLNIREYARIQSFPDTYEFMGTVTQQYKQIGNAVPVKLAEKLAQSIKKVLE
jgi:DNA (cytosine-5)-methyltransferase 1